MSRRAGRAMSLLPPGVRPLLPFLILPLLVLVALSIVLGPPVWEAVHASYRFCQSYLMHASAGHLIFSLAMVLSGFTIVAGVFGVIREVRQLRQLSRTLTQAGSTTAQVIPGQTVVLVPDRDPFAFCHGLLRPRLYLSTALFGILDGRELDAVLRHEEAHRRRRDPLRVFAVRVLAAALFFLPLARVARDRYLVRLEIRADQEVVRRVGREPLAGALVKLLQVSPAPMPAVAISRFNPTEERVRRLLEPAPQPRLAIVPGPDLLTNAVLSLNVGVFAVTAVYGVNWFLSGPLVCPMPMA